MRAGARQGGLRSVRGADLSFSSLVLKTHCIRPKDHGTLRTGPPEAASRTQGAAAWSGAPLGRCLNFHRVVMARLHGGSTPVLAKCPNARRAHTVLRGHERKGER